MKTVPIGEIENKVIQKFLRGIDGTLSYPGNPPIRCDQCSEVIHPNKTCSMIIADRLISENSSTKDLRLLRIECEDCTQPLLYYASTGYTEIFISGQFDEEYTLTNVGLIEASRRSDGLDWDPQELVDLFENAGKAVEYTSPSDFMRLIQKYMKPTEIVDLQSGDILIPEKDAGIFRLALLISITDEEMAKDDLKALQQSSDIDVSIEQIEQYSNALKQKTERLLRESISIP